jgi:hypothetical protein
VQGGASVAVTYDDASRRETLTLPNGIVATYGFDAASELTSLSYNEGGSNVGTLTYTYDAAGRIVARGGTLFQSILPAAQATTVYNADNQLTTWGAATLIYDERQSYQRRHQQPDVGRPQPAGGAGKCRKLRLRRR